MNVNKEYLLEWKNFDTKVAKVFKDLRKESDFYDVDLTCSDSDGRSLQAHKLILSASSSIFKQMLLQGRPRNQNNTNAALFLRGVKYRDLSSMLDFMYQGQIHIPQKNLTSFLSVAEDLKIEGLAMDDSEKTGIQNEDLSEPSSHKVYLKDDYIQKDINGRLEDTYEDLAKSQIRSAFKLKDYAEDGLISRDLSDIHTYDDYKFSNLFNQNKIADTYMNSRKIKIKDKKIRQSLKTESQNIYKPSATSIKLEGKTLEGIDEDQTNTNAVIEGSENDLYPTDGNLADPKLPVAENYYYENVGVSKQDKQRYQCRMCSKSSNHRGHVKEHVMDVHFPDAKTQCKHCNKLFKSGSLIRHHVAKCKLNIKNISV